MQEEINKKVDYDEELVGYCANCLSLKVEHTPMGIDCCMECGCTDINESTIEEWEERYKKRYGRYYVEF